MRVDVGMETAELITQNDVMREDAGRFAAKADGEGGGVHTAPMSLTFRPCPHFTDTTRKRFRSRI